jgi:hypothetical protein
MGSISLSMAVQRCWDATLGENRWQCSLVMLAAMTLHDIEDKISLSMRVLIRSALDAVCDSPWPSRSIFRSSSTNMRSTNASSGVRVSSNTGSAIAVLFAVDGRDDVSGLSVVLGASRGVLGLLPVPADGRHDAGISPICNVSAKYDAIGVNHKDSDLTLKHRACILNHKTGAM